MDPCGRPRERGGPVQSRGPAGPSPPFPSGLCSRRLPPGLLRRRPPAPGRGGLRRRGLRPPDLRDLSPRVGPPRGLDRSGAPAFLHKYVPEQLCVPGPLWTPGNGDARRTQPWLTSHAASAHVMQPQLTSCRPGSPCTQQLTSRSPGSCHAGPTHVTQARLTAHAAPTHVTQPRLTSGVCVSAAV